jgi:ribonuclease HI
VIIIPKSGKSDYESVSSFRPISLLSTFGKILEKIIHRRLLHYSEVKNWFNCFQHGFRSNRSTISALHELVSKIEYGFSQKANTGCLLLDIKGAFDNVTHQGILRCLKKKDCPEYLFNLIAGFLSERTATLQLNDKVKICKVQKGCPQGSPLSPFLWNVVCDEVLSKKFPPGVYIQGFADDISLTKTGVTAESIQFPLQVAADIVLQWSLSHKMEISANKTELIVFSRRQRNNCDINVTINGTIIQPSLQVKHLGLVLDQRLSWHAHILAKCIKTKQTIFHLRRLSKLTWGSSSKTLSYLYQAILEPMLLYGCFIWAPALKRRTLVGRLRSVQRLMATTVIRSFKSISSDSSFVITNWLPFDFRARQLAALTAAKLGLKQPSLFPGHVQFIFTELVSCGITLDSMDYPKPSPLQHLPPWSTLPFSLHADHTILLPLVPTAEEHYHIYTDGSKTAFSAGYAFLVINKDNVVDIVQRRLDDDCSIFEAETCAIIEALHFCKRHLHRGSVINISTDAMQVISSASSKKKILRFTHQLQESLLNLSELFTIHIHWVKSHSSNEGNQFADMYARQTAQFQRNNSKKFLSWKDAKLKIASFYTALWKEEWKISSKGAVTRAFFPTPKDATILKHVHLTHELTQILTGHCRLGVYLHRISAAETSMCNCSTAAETVEHFLFYCPLYDTQRDILRASLSMRTLHWPPPLRCFVSCKQNIDALKTFIVTSKRLDLGH